MRASPTLPTWPATGSISPSFPAITSWNNTSTISINAQVILAVDAPNAALGGMWSGKFLMQGFNVTGELGNKVQVAVDLLSDGEIVWTPAP